MIDYLNKANEKMAADMNERLEFRRKERMHFCGKVKSNVSK